MKGQTMGSVEQMGPEEEEVMVRAEAERRGVPRHRLFVFQGEVVRAERFFVFVEEMGAPDRSPGGIIVTRRYYDNGENRYATVLAWGPGELNRKTGRRAAMPEGLEVGGTLMFSRRFGSRLGFNTNGRMVRVLDPRQIVAMVEDFEPWWDVDACQIDAATFAG